MFLGFVLIILGVLFLLSRFDIFDFGDFVATWWPMILIIIGLKKMTAPGEPRFGSGFILFLIGVLFQLIELDVLSWNRLTYIWPLILIIIGLKLILSPRGRVAKPGTAFEKDEIDTVAIFGGTDISVTSQNFKGGQATALFGAVEIDLRGAKLSGGNATIRASAFFGGVDIKVPEDWQVEAEGTPLFGALESKCKAPDSPDAPRLHIKGSVLFGGIEVKQ